MWMDLRQIWYCEKLFGDRLRGGSNFWVIKNQWFPLKKPVAVNAALPLTRSK